MRQARWFAIAGLGILGVVVLLVIVGSMSTPDPDDNPAPVPTPVVTTSRLGISYNDLRINYEQYGFAFDQHVGTSPDGHTQIRFEVWQETLVSVGMTYDVDGGSRQAGEYIASLFDWITPGFADMNYPPSYYLDRVSKIGKVELTYREGLRAFNVRWTYNKASGVVTVRIAQG